ncbi:MAG: murein biosynthesis integral membrane protein MurJ [Nitratiruptor sp.]|nr:murein biosynthesis integral membrane protein MurJ [Nitratiruptor sp.]NPA83216.1 murein biosynthesis integral membrane protein MurJ [Campylobacterota bacterium]
MVAKIFTNTFGILTSRILGLIRDLLTAQILGANIYSDIFFVAFKFPNLFRRIFAEGAFAQTFLPAFSRTRRRLLFAAAIFTILLATTLLLSLLVTLFAPFCTRLIASGFDEELIRQAAPYVAITFYYLPLIFATTFLSALLHYKEHFATTAFATALLNLALITALLLWREAPKERILLALSLAVLVGGGLQLLLHLIALARYRLLAPFLKALGKLITGPWPWRDLATFFANFLPAIWGNSTAQLGAFLDTWLASFLAAGTISYLYYANRIFQLPLALFAIATATALFPSISKAIAQGAEERAFQAIQRTFWLLTSLLALSALGGILLAPQIVALLFERGNFTRADTIATAQILQMYLVGLLFFGLGKLFALWIYAHGRQKEAAKIATISLGANLLLSLILITPLQGAGLALASSLSGAVQFLLLVRAFGWHRFLALLKDRFAIYLLIALALEAGILTLVQRLIDATLR